MLDHLQQAPLKYNWLSNMPLLTWNQIREAYFIEVKKHDQGKSFNVSRFLVN